MAAPIVPGVRRPTRKGLFNMTEKTLRKRKPSRPSSITVLDPKIKEAVDTAVREGRLTIDEIVTLIATQGGDASRSAVGRYVKNAKEKMEDYRQAMQVASVWVDKIGKEPQGDVGRMVLEILKVVAFNSIGDIQQVAPEDLMFLAKAMKDIAGADKLAVDREINVRKLIAARAAEVASSVAKTAKKAGLSDETINVIRAEILGIPDAKPKGAAHETRCHAHAQGLVRAVPGLPRRHSIPIASGRARAPLGAAAAVQALEPGVLRPVLRVAAAREPLATSPNGR
jgi:hypothetical protein